MDLNVPGAKSSERISELSQCIQFLNDLAPDRHACLLEMAEFAKKSSRRGISDEEREVEEALWGLRQGLDVRWIMPFNLHPSAEQHSTRRLAWEMRLISGVIFLMMMLFEIMKGYWWVCSLPFGILIEASLVQPKETFDIQA